jgi:hypothetical protein
MNTPIETQAEILAELWMDYRDEEYFAEFIGYADLGLPLSYLLANNIVTRNTETDKFVSDTWEVFIGLCGHQEDTGFELLHDVLVDSPYDLKDE